MEVWVRKAGDDGEVVGGHTRSRKIGPEERVFESGLGMVESEDFCVEIIWKLVGDFLSVQSRYI